MAAPPLESVLRRDRLLIGACLGALCLLAWAWLAHLALRMATMEGLAARMMGMTVDDGLSAWLGAALAPGAAALADAAVNFVLVALMWAVMMVGMMLPAAAPTILLFAALERRRVAAGAAGGRVALFVIGYLAAWGGFSVAAAAAQTALAATGLMSMQMAVTSGVLGGALFVGAGLVELTPLKDRCLAHCRSPVEWLARHMRPGRAGALRMGLGHGVYCVGCCWGLMVLLFAGGVMNLAWVAALAAVVLVQKLMPNGRAAARWGGWLLVAAGIALAARGLLAG